MVTVPNLKISDYDYELPEARIAKYPVARGEAKLLQYQNNSITQKQYKNLPELLSPDDVLIFNETKVVQARLLFPLNENRLIEIFCLEPQASQSVEEAMQQQNHIIYKALIGGAKKWKQGTLSISLGEDALYAEKIARNSDDFTVKLSWTGNYTFSEILEKAGKTPLPPYLKRAAEASDKTNYQSVFARFSGSVAAPTASLHFNTDLVNNLKQKGVTIKTLVLHVGAGTFKPVATDEVTDHEMHAEEFSLSLHFVREIQHILHGGKNIIPVGTTALRAIESMYWTGCYLAEQPESDLTDFTLPQWYCYEASKPLEPAHAFKVLEQYLQKRGLDHLQLKTQIIIAPGYTHRIIKALITNFHQPKSTLLLLIASLIGDQWKTLYQYAMQHNFRFLSYGDGCLIYPNK